MGEEGRKVGGKGISPVSLSFFVPIRGRNGEKEEKKKGGRKEGGGKKGDLSSPIFFHHLIISER